MESDKDRVDNDVGENAPERIQEQRVKLEDLLQRWGWILGQEIMSKWRST